MLTCKDVIMDLLFDYLEQALSSELVTDLEMHLTICAPCRAYIETYRKTKDLVGMAARPPMPDEMKARLREFLIKKLAEEKP